MIYSKFLINRPSSQKGLTNIELMLALVVAAAIIMGGLRQYQSYMYQKNVATIDSSVKLLFNATQEYYFANCSSIGNVKSINIKNDLVNNDFLASEKLIQDPFDPTNTSAYTSKITFNDENARYTIEVSFRFPGSMDTDAVKAYAGLLNPSEISGTTVKWRQNVTARGKSSAAGLSPLADDIDRFSRGQTVKQGYEKFKPPSAKDPCTLQ